MRSRLGVSLTQSLNLLFFLQFVYRVPIHLDDFVLVKSAIILNRSARVA